MRELREVVVLAREDWHDRAGRGRYLWHNRRSEKPNNYDVIVHFIRLFCKLIRRLGQKLNRGIKEEGKTTDGVCYILALFVKIYFLFYANVRVTSYPLISLELLGFSSRLSHWFSAI